MNHRSQFSEGVFVYVFGLVVIATHPDRFRLGLALAVTPILIGALGRSVGGERWNRL